MSVIRSSPQKFPIQIILSRENFCSFSKNLWVRMSLSLTYSGSSTNDQLRDSHPSQYICFMKRFQCLWSLEYFNANFLKEAFLLCKFLPVNRRFLGILSMSSVSFNIFVMSRSRLGSNWLQYLSWLAFSKRFVNFFSASNYWKRAKLNALVRPQYDVHFACTTQLVLLGIVRKNAKMCFALCLKTR